MSLRFVWGRAGTGKSRLVLDRLIKESVDRPEEKFFLIVPDQFTMETQQEMIRRHPRHGTMNLDVVSFHRLAYRVFEEQGIRDLKVLDDIGKSMLLRRGVRRRRREFTVFSGNLDKSGFFDQLKSMISELMQYGVTEADLEELKEKTAARPALRQKISDIAVAMRAFREELSEDTVPAEELLDVLCGAAGRSALLKGSTVVLDGFTGFTPVQLRLLTLLMEICASVTVTVTIDPEEAEEALSEEDLFLLSSETVAKVRRCARAAGCREEAPVCLTRPVRWEEESSLTALEREILRAGRGGKSLRPREIFLESAADPAEEAALLGAQILRLVREEGLRFRDIAVICSDMETYRHFLARSLWQLNIPYFLDDKRRLDAHPSVSYVQSVLEAVQKGFDYDSVMRYLRSSYSGADREEADRMDEYLRRRGFAGAGDWPEEWIGPLLRLKEGLIGKGLTAADRCQAFSDFLTESGFPEKLTAEAEERRRDGDLQDASLCEQAWDLISGLLARMRDVLGGEEMSFAEWKDVIETGLHELKAGLIPNTMDRLVIGDLERTRLGNVKAVCFIGVNEGKVPRTAHQRRLLSDRDREVLSDLNVELSPAAKKNAYIQRFYLYLTLTKASRFLLLSFSRADTEGKEMLPSSLIREVRTLFPEIRELRPEPFLFLGAERSARDLALSEVRRVREGRQENALLRPLLSWYRRSQPETYENWLDISFSGYRPEALPKDLSLELYGSLIPASVTRLETYASCAYEQFLKYGLFLKERKEARFEDKDLGSVYHECIARFFFALEEQKKDLTSLSSEELSRIAGAAADAVTDRYGEGILGRSSRAEYQKERVRETVLCTLTVLKDELSEGRFAPYASEMSFSPHDAAALRLHLAREAAVMLLSGRIDRLDISPSEDGKRLLVRIVDYKSSDRKIDLGEAWYGLQLQLPFYLLAACEVLEKRFPGREIVPAVIEYAPIGDPLVPGEADMTQEEVYEAVREKLKPRSMAITSHEALAACGFTPEEIERMGGKTGAVRGTNAYLVRPEQMKKYLDMVREKTAGLGEEMIGGAIPVNPYKTVERSSCTFCPYQTVCGFDRKRPGYRYRSLPEIGPEDIWGKEG